MKSGWWDMGPYAMYVWGSYAMLALAVIVELLALRMRRTRALGMLDSADTEESPS